MLLTLQAGTDLYEALRSNGAAFVCGGNGICGKCKIRVLSGDVPVTDADRAFFSEPELEEGYRLACKQKTIDSDIELEYSPEEIIYVPEKLTGMSEFSTCNTRKLKEYSYAVDIGTTTIAVGLVDTYTGEIVETVTGINRQRGYGADVISRIVAANNGNGPKLRELVLDSVNELTDRLIEKYSLEIERLKDIIISANTTMQHIFAGYSCEGLGFAPFSPVSLELTRRDCVTLLPGISTYVGADIVSGIYYCDMAEGNGAEGLSLLIDLGTNGEMALGNSQKLLVASTAAGPAFEGGNISCGMASIPGAICNVKLSDADDEEPIVLTTIADAKPVGICGTGVVALVSELLDTGLIDETGLLDERLKGRIKLTADGKVIFTQKDIRELQLAKSAIRAGIETLLFTYGAEYDDIDKVYIAGGFGAELDIDKACRIGILPQELKSACISVGNTSLKGAARFAGDAQGEEKLNRIRRISSEVVLADNSFFVNSFTANMNFK